MTAITPGGAFEPVTITAAWPQTANAGAQVANIHAYQWDQDRSGVYLMMGHLGMPIWVAPGDRELWEKDHLDHRVPVESLGAFYMTEKVAKDLCKGLAQFLGLAIGERVTPGDHS